MDTSEKYVRMCEEAEEIQRKAKLIDNFWFHGRWGVGVGTYWQPCLGCDYEMEKAFYFDGYGIKLSEKLGDMVWLPRQDQLQEMIDFDLVDRDSLLGLADFGGNFFHTDDSISWEQFWLAFVMQEEFNKIWVDEREEWASESIRKE